MLRAEDKYYEVLEEVPRVRKDFGECPLVTPSSQIVGTQAVMNVIMRRALQDGSPRSPRIFCAVSTDRL